MKTVKVLAAKQAGELAVELRGQGQDRVRMVLQNTSSKRLRTFRAPVSLSAAILRSISLICRRARSDMRTLINARVRITPRPPRLK